MLESTLTGNDARSDLIRQAKLIVWDEAPMANKTVMQCVNDVCKKIMKNNRRFGGKAIILLGITYFSSHIQHNVF